MDRTPDNYPMGKKPDNYPMPKESNRIFVIISVLSCFNINLEKGRWLAVIVERYLRNYINKFINIIL